MKLPQNAVRDVMIGWSMLLSRRKEDLTAKLLATFKQLISEGTLAPGARRPSGRWLQPQCQPRLRSPGLKMLSHGRRLATGQRGTYLNAPAPSILAEPMGFLILLNSISFEELMDSV